jgi:hypothetical protein
MNPYVFLLRWMTLEWDHTKTSRILTTLGEGIEAAGNAVSEVAGSTDPEWIDSIVDDEASVVEDLLGASFVVCQTFITAMVSRVYRAHDVHERLMPGQPLQTTAKNKWDILRFQMPTVGTSGYGAVELINGFANYWKHREEWVRSDWQAPRTQSQRGTIEVISAAGATEGSTGNLRTAAELLGNSSYSDLQVFSDALGTWSEGLLAAYAREFADRNLIPKREK